MGDNKLLEEILAEPEFYKASSFYKRGHKEGEEIALLGSILEILAARFGDVPEDVRQLVSAMHDSTELKSLVRSAARAVDMNAFRGALSGAAG